jgi:transcriptional regulator with XRE-family HTH domain
MPTKIRDIRKSRGLTLQALADRVGTTAQTIQRLETGNMTVSVDWLTRIGNALDLAPAQLLLGPSGPSIPVLGSLLSTGQVTVEPTAKQPPLRLDVPAPDPVAVALKDRLGPYEPGTMLIASRLTRGVHKEADGRDCLVETVDGRLLFRRIVHNRGGPSAFVPYETRAAIERNLAIAWLAPVVLAIRYL